MIDNIKSLWPIIGLALLFMLGGAIMGWAWFLIAKLNG